MFLLPCLIKAKFQVRCFDKVSLWLGQQAHNVSTLGSDMPHEPISNCLEYWFSKIIRGTRGLIWFASKLSNSLDPQPPQHNIIVLYKKSSNFFTKETSVVSITKTSINNRHINLRLNLQGNYLFLLLKIINAFILIEYIIH